MVAAWCGGRPCGVGLANRIPLSFANGTRQMLKRDSRVLCLLPLSWAHVGLGCNKHCCPLDARHPTVRDWGVLGNVGWLKFHQPKLIIWAVASHDAEGQAGLRLHLGAMLMLLHRSVDGK